MIQDKAKNVEIKVGYVVHVGPSNSPRCSIQDPNNLNRRWVLKPGDRSGMMSVDDTSNIYLWVIAHKHLKFNLVSAKVKVAGDSGAPAPSTKVSGKHAKWVAEKQAKNAKKHLPKPMGDIEGLPSPKALLESKASPKGIIEPTVEPVKPEAEPEVVEPEIEEPAINIYDYLLTLDYAGAVEVAKINDVDLGRTSSLNGTLNKIYKHLEQNGEEGFVTIPAG